MRFIHDSAIDIYDIWHATRQHQDTARPYIGKKERRKFTITNWSDVKRFIWKPHAGNFHETSKILADILVPCTPSYFPASAHPSTSTIMKTHCSNRIFFRKFETKDMEHKGQFCRQLLHINPLASSLCSHCCPLFLQPFPLIIDHRHSSQQMPTAGHQSSNESHSPSSLLPQIHQMRNYFNDIPKMSRTEILQ